MVFCAVFLKGMSTVSPLEIEFLKIGPDFIFLMFLYSCICLCGVLAWPWEPLGLSSWTRDGTRFPCIGRRIPNHWTTRKVPSLSSFEFFFDCLPFDISWGLVSITAPQALWIWRSGGCKVVIRRNVYKAAALPHAPLGELKQEKLSKSCSWVVYETGMCQHKHPMMYSIISLPSPFSQLWGIPPPCKESQTALYFSCWFK